MKKRHFKVKSYMTRNLLANLIGLVIIPCIGIIGYCLHSSRLQVLNQSSSIRPSIAVQHSMTVRIRSNLARSLYARMKEDEALSYQDKSTWYIVRKDMLSQEAQDVFIQLSYDNDTKEFLENSHEKSDWLFTQMYHSVAKAFLSWFISPTSINGLLRRGAMFVYSKQQFHTLMGQEEKWRAENLLDLGAGDGEVTCVMADMFDHVFTTEMSRPMIWRLEEKGYKNFAIDEWQKDNFYDVISCLNVIDRCSEPITLLRDIQRSLKSSQGRAVIAVVLPYRPYVEFNSTDHLPSERLEISGKTFEEQVNSLIANVFTKLGFRVLRFSRVPYLCEGDLEHSFYRLDDAIFVLEAT